MKLKNMFLIFLVIFTISSCATFKPLKSKNVSLVGIFNANYKGNEFSGFFSISGGNLKLDVVNSFGFSVYGIYVEGGKVFLKDYQTGKIYYHLKVNGNDFDKYKPVIKFIARDFLKLCEIQNKSIVILRCERVKNYYVPRDLILKSSVDRLRMQLKNLKIKE